VKSLLLPFSWFGFGDKRMLSALMSPILWNA
jgi:hypothetical protein